MADREKYKVIRKLDAGGMAEVYEAVAEGIEGFEKKVAIKRVLPHLAENKKFIAMFLDEARLSLHLSHANVVQVFDIGQAGGTYFIVMEFVNGTNLKALMQKMKSRNQLLPIEQSIFIVMEMCRGLSYAHGLKDAKGRSLGIVHRDVSPPNVLISKQGEVKIVDFGLAKATSQLEVTDPGVVKGKYAYLSPEAATGKKVDLRMDVFCCGIVLYELLTGQRLFLGNTDVETINNVRAGYVPSMQQFNPGIHPQLEGIVRSALAVDPNQRYQTCDDLAESLAHFLFSAQLKVTGFDIRRTLENVIGDPNKHIDKQAIIDNFIQQEIAVFSSLDGGMTLRRRPPSRTSNPNAPVDVSGFNSHSGSPPGYRDSNQSMPGAYTPSGAYQTGSVSNAGYEEEEDDGTEDRQNFWVGLTVALAAVTLIIAIAWALGFIP
ncbi:MAG: serine/threonine protein kinase [Deltaproteobacteria bacterium]|nr:serine/threonine protein kinase [Deltaproteobacteria bacterium]